MKLAVTCFKCTFDNPSEFVRIETFLAMQEEDLYHYKCVNGHHNLLEIQAFKFEILFESGLCAIKDMYYLESVLSLTASLERFYEFFIRVLMKANGISNDCFENTFSVIAKQSERQFGAFVTLYCNHFKEAPKVLISNKSVEFRNKVVHKGYLPNENEVLQYAEEIFKIIKYYYVKLRLNYNQLISNYWNELQILRRSKNSELINELKIPITLSTPCFAISFSMNIDSFQKKEFKECFDLINRTNFYG